MTDTDKILQKLEEQGKQLFHPQTDVSAMKSDIGTLKSVITAVKSDMTVLKNDVSTLKRMLQL